MKIEDLRIKINEIDEKLRVLFEERMHTVSKVAEYKIKNNMEIFDSKREQDVIEKNSDLLNDKELKEYYLEYLNTLLKVSKDYQKKIIGK